MVGELSSEKQQITTEAEETKRRLGFELDIAKVNADKLQADLVAKEAIIAKQAEQLRKQGQEI